MFIEDKWLGQKHLWLKFRMLLTLRCLCHCVNDLACFSLHFQPSRSGYRRFVSFLSSNLSFTEPIVNKVLVYERKLDGEQFSEAAYNVS